MKKKYLRISYFYYCFLFFTNNCFSQNLEILKTSKLEIKNSQIITLLDTTYYKFNGNIKSNRDMFILSINKYKGVIEMRITATGENLFRWYYYDKRKTLFGITKYKGINVLVFGNGNLFFKKTNEINSSFFEKRVKKKGEKIVFAPIYDFFVWIYYYKDGKFLLDRIGNFDPF
jgi:hypothetical protein